MYHLSHAPYLTGICQIGYFSFCKKNIKLYLLALMAHVLLLHHSVVVAPLGIARLGCYRIYIQVWYSICFLEKIWALCISVGTCINYYRSYTTHIHPNTVHPTDHKCLSPMPPAINYTFHICLEQLT